MRVCIGYRHKRDVVGSGLDSLKTLAPFSVCIATLGLTSTTALVSSCNEDSADLFKLATRFTRGKGTPNLAHTLQYDPHQIFPLLIGNCPSSKIPNS